MGLLTRQPDLHRIIKELEDRVRYLERTRRLTVTTVSDYRQRPAMAQSGDLMVDSSTGFLYIFMFDGNTTVKTTTSINYAGFTDVEFANRVGFKPGQSVALTIGSTVYYSWISPTDVRVPVYGSTVQPGFVGLQLRASSVNPDFPTPPAPLVVPAGSKLEGRSWRQIIDATTFRRLIPSVGIYNFAGFGSAHGGITQGLGEMIGNGYPPSNAASG